jgi:tripartite-type tricarboxylate transporter receptor subunit TctC
MKTIPKSFAALMLCVSAICAHAQYPDRPVRLIVPFTPGGNVDATGRIVASGLTEVLGQAVIIDNKAGAAGLVGSEFVAHAAPDGYTMLLGSTGALAPLKGLHPHATLSPTKDFAAAATIARAPLVLAISPSIPVKDLAEFIAYAKQRPGKLAMATSGVGTAAHLTGELFQKLSGTRFLHVPYRGGAVAVADLLGGHVDLTFDQLASMLSQIRAGKLHALGVTTAQRTSVMPELPTISELGLPNFESSTTTGLLFPVGTPKNIIAKMNAAMQTVLRMPKTKNQFRDLGSDVLLGSGADFDRILASEIDKWSKVIKQAGIQPVD